MEAQDLTNWENNRAEAIRQLQRLCDDLGLSYEYTQKAFKIKLPHQEPLPSVHEVARKQRRKMFDWDAIPSSGEHELPDEFPPTTTPLTEGEPPQGDDEA